MTGALGVALLIASVGLVRAYLRLLERARMRDGIVGPYRSGAPELGVRPIPTAIVGALGGLVVGITSVGSGSLIIVALMVCLSRAPPMWMLVRRRHGFPARSGSHWIRGFGRERAAVGARPEGP